MASEGSSKQTGASKRRPRTAAEQRAERAAPSNDPEVLAQEIERTREELAETLDAIADKVSPKRVASRTKKKVGDAVKDGAEGAAATVKAGTSQLKDAVTARTDVVKDKAEGVGEAVKEKTAAAKDKVTPSSGDDGLGDALEGVGQDPGAQTLATPVPATTTPAGVAGPSGSGLHAVPPPPPGSSAVPLRLGPPAAAGALAALLAALFVLRRRRSARRRWR